MSTILPKMMTPAQETIQVQTPYARLILLKINNMLINIEVMLNIRDFQKTSGNFILQKLHMRTASNNLSMFSLQLKKVQLFTNKNS